VITRRALPLLASPALAQGWAPERPMRLIVPFTPGGSTDIIARVVAQRLGALLGQSVVVENRPGAGGTIGSDAVAKAAPDGHTLLMGHIGTLAVNPGLYPRLPYDDERAFAPIALVATVANFLAVTNGLPVRNMAEFLGLARRDPGGIAYGSGGNGSATHIAVSALQEAAGLRFTHIPYRGTGPMMTDLIAGQIQMTMTGGPPALPPIRAGQISALGVSALAPVPAAPEIPAIAATVPGFEALQWYGVVGPAGMPGTAVARINAAIHTMLQEPETRARLEPEAADPAPGTPEEFGRFISAEKARWGALIRRAGVRAD
jgi:tripartite-type tricarboxylate transporter receptor subunit TctC